MWALIRLDNAVLGRHILGMDNEQLTSTQCAEIAGLSNGSVWNRAVSRSPELQEARIYLDGRTVRWPRSAVDTWMASRPGRGRWGSRSDRKD